MRIEAPPSCLRPPTLINYQLPRGGLKGNKYLPPCSAPTHASLGLTIASQYERQGGSFGPVFGGEGSVL